MIYGTYQLPNGEWNTIDEWDDEDDIRDARDYLELKAQGRPWIISSSKEELDALIGSARLTVSDVAKELGITERRVTALISSGKLKAVKRGRSWEINQSDVDAIRDRKPGWIKGRSRAHKTP